MDYEYLVHFKYKGRDARCFIVTNLPVNSEERVIAMEEDIVKRHYPDADNLIVVGFQLLGNPK